MDWLDSTQTALAAVGLKLVNAVVAAFGSFVSLRFFNNISTMDRWSIALGGWAIAAWGAGPLREYLEQKPSIEIGFVILLSLFGMALTSEIIKGMRETNWAELIKSIINWRKGGGQ